MKHKISRGVPGPTDYTGTAGEDEAFERRYFVIIARLNKVETSNSLLPPCLSVSVFKYNGLVTLPSD